MQLPFLHGKDEKEAVLVFDIGTGSVAAGVVLVGHEGPARVAASRRATLSHEERSDEQRLSAIRESLEFVGKEVLSTYTASELFKRYHAPSRAVANIHSPWVHSHTNEAGENFPQLKKIEKALIQAVGKKAGASDEEKLPGHEMLETLVVRVELNGYPTGNPLGKEALSIRTLVLKSTIESKAKQLFESTLSALLPGRPVKLASAMFAYSKVLKEIPQAGEHYLFIDMTSEASACSVVHGGVVRDLGIVPTGWRTLARSVAEKKKGTPAEALSLIGMVTDGTCTDAECATIEQAITEVEGKYMKAFGEMFSSKDGVQRLPHTLYLSVHPRLALWARHFFGRLDFGQFTETGRPFVAKSITTKALAEQVVYTTEARPDAGIGVAAALVHIHGA